MSINHIVAKSDFHVLKDDMFNMKMEIKEDIHKMKIEMLGIKNDMYKALFLLGFIVQLIAILGGRLAIVKFLR